jgi:effector-binding domain-containing protein
VSVSRFSVAARPTAVIAASTTWPEFPKVWKALLDEVHATVVWGDVSRPKGRNVMLYLDDTPRVEVGVELDQPAEVSGRVVRSHLPAGPVAVTVHRGPYDGLGGAHDAVHAWCRAEGLTLAGPRWEVYGHWHEDPAQVETEITYLLAG